MSSADEFYMFRALAIGLLVLAIPPLPAEDAPLADPAARLRLLCQMAHRPPAAGPALAEANGSTLLGVPLPSIALPALTCLAFAAVFVERQRILHRLKRRRRRSRLPVRLRMMA